MPVRNDCEGRIFLLCFSQLQQLSCRLHCLVITKLCSLSVTCICIPLATESIWWGNFPPYIEPIEAVLDLMQVTQRIAYMMTVIVAHGYGGRRQVLDRWKYLLEFSPNHTSQDSLEPHHQTRIKQSKPQQKRSQWNKQQQILPKILPY